MDIVTPIVKVCSTDSTTCIPHFLDTDVNAPAMADFKKKKKTVSSLAYIRVRTGVGVGLVVLPSSSVALTERIIARESTTTTTTTTTSRDDLALPEDTDVIGGGIMKRTILYTKIRTRVTELINGYVSLPYDLDDFFGKPHGAIQWDL